MMAIKSNGNKSFLNRCRREENIIKMVIRKTESEDVKWIKLAQKRAHFITTANFVKF
jgi:hypothetical protein